jgi:hypothetical protein
VNNDLEWEVSFNTPRDRGISYFEKYFGYEELNKTVNPNNTDDVLCHQYPFLINSPQLFEKVSYICNGNYTNKGPIVREFIYNNKNLINKNDCRE